MKKLKNSELNRISVSEFKNASKSPIIIILDNIRSAHNVGSIFRTCDAFLINEIILCGITATPPNNEIRKTALGSTESVDWRYFDNIEEAVLSLRKEGFQIISIEQADKSLKLEKFSPKKNEKYAFIFGNEIKGIDQKIIDISDNIIEIPQFGTKHSLNVSVSAGIVIWDVFSKISLGSRASFEGPGPLQMALSRQTIGIALMQSFWRAVGVEIRSGCFSRQDICLIM